MSPRTGRPTDNPKRHETRIRMSDDDVYKLNFIAEKLSMTKADVIRKGIDELYKSVK